MIRAIDGIVSLLKNKERMQRLLMLEGLRKYAIRDENENTNQ